MPHFLMWICFATGGGSQVGGFLPALKQIGNVAALPGIVSKSIGLPDVHAGLGPNDIAYFLRFHFPHDINFSSSTRHYFHDT